MRLAKNQPTHRPTTRAVGTQVLFARLQRTLLKNLSRREALQFRRQDVENIVTFAREACDYYKPRLACVAGPPGLLFDRWPKIPLSTKSDVAKHPGPVLSAYLPAGSGRVRTGWTSGSEGVAFHYAHTALSDLVNNHATRRFFQWWQLDGGKSLAQIKTTRSPRDMATQEAVKFGWLAGNPLGQRHMFPSGIDIDRQLDWLLRVKPAYLKAYPEALRELARVALERHIDLRFDLLMSGGGVLTADTRQACQEAFGCRIADFYGAEEVGSIAAECPHCGEYHVASENVFLEVLKEDGSEAQPGETGRAVLTTLHNHAMPLIRYHIGDYVEVGQPKGRCEHALQTIRGVIGRQKSLFKLANGRTIWPTVPAQEIGRLGNVSRYQFIQVALDRVEFRYVPNDETLPLDPKEIDQLIKTYIDPSLTSLAVPVSSIEREESQKYMLFKSMLS